MSDSLSNFNQELSQDLNFCNLSKSVLSGKSKLSPNFSLEFSPKQNRIEKNIKNNAKTTEGIRKGLLPAWFAKFLAGLWIFGVMMLFVSALSSQVTNMRMIDAGLGLLKSGQVNAGQNFLDKISKPVSFGSVNVYAACPTPCPTIVLNLNEILNSALKQAVSALINSIMNALMGLFDKLMQAIEQAIGGFEGLSDALGSFKAAIYMKAQEVTNQLNESATAFVDRVFPSEYSQSPELKSLLENAVASRDYLVAANTSQEGVLSPVPNTPTKAQIEKISKEIQNVAKSDCKRPNLINNGTDALFGLQCGKAVTESASVANELAARDAVAKKAAAQAEKNIVDQAPADCRLKGYLNVNGDIGSGSSGGSNSSGGFASSSAFTNATSFSVDAKSFVNTYEPKMLNPEECNNLDRGPATLAAAQAQSNQTSNEFDFNAILKKFIEALTKFFTQLVEKVVGIITSAINNFLSKIPGGRYFSDALGNITNSLMPSIRQGLEQASDNLFKLKS